MPKRHAKHRKGKPLNGWAPLDDNTNDKRAPSMAPRRVSPAASKRIRLSSGLLGLSSAAILTVYGLGYVQTRTLSGPNVVAIATQPPSPQTSVGQSRPTAPSAAAPPAPGASPSSPQTAQAKSGYKDGTYVGRGTSRHGDIEATVVIQGGKIVSAKVSRCQTRYPCSDVSPLVNEVLSIQKAPVHHVSGASDSSRAYTQAVSNALAQATQA